MPNFNFAKVQLEHLEMNDLKGPSLAGEENTGRRGAAIEGRRMNVGKGVESESLVIV
jgi:hypothetical protein